MTSLPDERRSVHVVTNGCQSRGRIRPAFKAQMPRAKSSPLGFLGTTCKKKVEHLKNPDFLAVKMTRKLPGLEHKRRHCLPLNFFLIPLGVDTTSPFLYLCGVAGSDLGEVGVDLGRIKRLAS